MIMLRSTLLILASIIVCSVFLCLQDKGMLSLYHIYIRLCSVIIVVQQSYDRTSIWRSRSPNSEKYSGESV